MEPDSVMRLQEWFKGWCVGNFGDGFHAYEPYEFNGTWKVQATIFARSYDHSRITPAQILDGVWQMVLADWLHVEGWEVVDFTITPREQGRSTLAIILKWIGVEEEEIPTLHRTRQLEDDALQDHLRLLPLISRTGVVEEAWAKVNGVRARAERDHREWRREQDLLCLRLARSAARWMRRKLFEIGTPVAMTPDGVVAAHQQTDQPVGVVLSPVDAGGTAFVLLD